MATRLEIEAKLKENEEKRQALAEKLGPATNEAQSAYNQWQFLKFREDQTYSPNWSGGINGRRFTDPKELDAYAKSIFEEKAEARKQIAVEFNALFPEKEQLENQLATLEDPTTTVKSPENTNESQTEKASEQKQQNAEIVGNTATDTEFGDLETAQKFQSEAPQRELANELDRESRRGNTGGLGTRGVPPGAEPRKVKAAVAQFKDSRGNVKGTDLRVKIRVPAEYIVSPGITNSAPLEDLGGILFPYTPNISYSHNAEYKTETPLHSNYALHFYKNSYVSKINISGKFTVQNDTDAEIFIATVQLLRALTKMRSGGRKLDPYSGSPPPVCRLDAYGDYMLSNVPVVITEFKMEVSDGVDYYTFGKLGFTDNISSVPTVATLSVGLAPMYSRAEAQKFAVTNYLDSYLKTRKEGYL